jgi:hypothetical protein
MHGCNSHHSFLLTALALLSISQLVNAQQNFNLDKVKISSSATLPTHKTIVTPSTPPPPPLTVVVPTTPPPPTVTTPTPPPLLASVPQGQATTAAAEGVCATPLEFLQRRQNVGTFLAAMQVSTEELHLYNSRDSFICACIHVRNIIY